MPAETDQILDSDLYAGTRHPRETYALIGHEAAEASLLAAYRGNVLPQAILLGGPMGIGKATLAWRLARFLLAHPAPHAPEVTAATTLHVPQTHPISHQIASLAHPDLVLLRREWNERGKKFFSEIRVDDVRRTTHLFQQAAGAGGYRIAIIDSVEDLNASGANALLKLIEEPPPRSLFLLISHRPGHVLPTLRSRCRLMSLKPLSDEALAAIIAELGPPWTDSESARHQASLLSLAQAAHGSLHPLLRRLDPNGRGIEATVNRLLGDLPRVDWRGVHVLADQIATDPDNNLEILRTTIFDWLDARLHAQTRQMGSVMPLDLHSLAPLAEVWDKVTSDLREAEALNLDKRQLILSLFTDLAAAVEASTPVLHL
ncbi:DNA polymerase III subunit delta' [Beijerinckia indica]|uniref:Putative DNA polymerase III delta prime subunit n=1 Tax=Beijerinckia indica subsp. indica (strain ATCC 9039 / DSM 1715 / NCIMB 8712) TaxID=395963 RepID=B2IB84_BEII9|nr:DNA polymerase III subunit delta' [Beijerinckia indica]ACB95168.1 putative DNA polymerase III delta prime subunit [Beijerinckia indica subsp. indica ATCC 9039]